MKYSENLLSIINKSNSEQLKGLVTHLKFKEKEIYNEILKFQKDNNLKTLAESIYLYSHNINIKPICSSNNCNNSVYFISIKEGYAKYCKKCSHNTKEYKEKLKNSIIQKYGVDNYSKTKEYKEKQKHTYYSKTEEERKKNIQKSKRNIAKKLWITIKQKNNRKKEKNMFTKFWRRTPTSK